MYFLSLFQFDKRFILLLFHSYPKKLLETFAHDTTALLLCHVQKFGVTTRLESGWEEYEIFIEFESW